MVGRGVADSLTSMATSPAAALTTKSTSVPAVSVGLNSPFLSVEIPHLVTVKV